MMPPPSCFTGRPNHTGTVTLDSSVQIICLHWPTNRSLFFLSLMHFAPNILRSSPNRCGVLDTDVGSRFVLFLLVPTGLVQCSSSFRTTSSMAWNDYSLTDTELEKLMIYLWKIWKKWTVEWKADRTKALNCSRSRSSLNTTQLHIKTT